MKAIRHIALLGIPTVLCATLAACGGGGGGGGSSPSSFSIGGSASGFTGVLQLLDNGSDSLSLSQPGTFTFAKKVASGSPYAVSVGMYPPAQYCSIANGSGTAKANVSNVGVSCAPGTLKTLYTFGSTTQAPVGVADGDLTLGADGNYYGTTAQGGAKGEGTLFKMTPAGQVTVLYSFGMAANDGTTPYGRPVYGPKGNLYGVTNSGGSNGLGTLYEVDPATGQETVLVDFNGTADGSNPTGSPLLGSNGKLYGTTLGGGQFGEGVLYDYDLATNTFTSLHDFAGGNLPAANQDLGHPHRSLMQATNGLIYGTTLLGGADGIGGVYQWAPGSGATSGYQVVASFTGATGQPAHPDGGLVQSSNGELYGVSLSGGTGNHGTIYSVNLTNNTISTLYDFTGGQDGEAPNGTPCIGSDGNLYVVAGQGGLSGATTGTGTVDEVSTAGVLQRVVYTFPATGQGSTGQELQGPVAGLIVGANGFLYGLAETGGGSTGGGGIYQID